MGDSKLKIDIRREKILELLQKTGRVSVSQLSRDLGATPVTIRSDLSALERDGYLSRVQGGAVSISRPNTPQNTAIANESQKQIIAESLAEKIQDGDTVFLNSGTTTLVAARALKVRRGLYIVTNSLSVALELGAVPTFRVLLLGGEINAQYAFTYGADAQEQLRRYQAAWAVLSVDGVSCAGGITTYHAEEAIIDRMMLAQAKRIVIAADSAKLGRTGFTQIAALTPDIHLLTDSGCPESVARELEQTGLSVEMCG